MRRCEHGACTKLEFAAGWCLDHYAEYRRIPVATCRAIQGASGGALSIAREYGVSVFRVWEIRNHRHFGHHR